MRAAVLHGVGEPLTIEDVKLDNPWPHEVVVRTAACGVCRSDLHFIEGHYGTDLPVVLGHEAAGVVEAVGSEVTYVQPGDRVNIELDSMTQAVVETVERVMAQRG